MNAIVQSHAPAAGTSAGLPRRTHKFRLLLRRELWEHKGGFLWAPIIAGGISLVLSAMAIVLGLVAAHRAGIAGELEIDGVNVNGLDLGLLTSRLGPEEMQQLAQGMNLTLFLSSAWPFIVLGFVVFFYCLGTLYDDRKDRSVLFWKSLPLSDAETVLSKVFSATVVAPVLAVLTSLATMLGFMVLLSVVVLAYGGNPWTLLWAPSSPLTIALGHLAWVPVFALWALPTVGWLLMCSAWSRSKPFLWALMIPLFAGIFVAWFDLMELFDLATSWFWMHVVGRLLLGTFPGTDLLYRDFDGTQGLEHALGEMSAGYQLQALAMPELWIGAAVGAVMIFAAIRLRRWRDEG